MKQSRKTVNTQTAIAGLLTDVGNEFGKLENSVSDSTQKIASKREEVTISLTELTAKISEESAGK